MADYIAQGNKTIHCKCGCTYTVPFQTTSCTCPTCGCKSFVRFFGVVIDKHGNYTY